MSVCLKPITETLTLSNAVNGGCFGDGFVTPAEWVTFYNTGANFQNCVDGIQLVMKDPGASNITNMQTDILFAFDKYFKTPDPQIQNSLITMCNAVENLCTKVQETVCVPNCELPPGSKMTDMAVQLCGCYFKPNQFTKDNPECDPVCSQSTTVKKYDSKTGKTIKCKESICVIDGISITATNSTVGSLSFEQICPNCTNGCKCIIDSNLKNIGNLFHSKETFDQKCGTTGICYQLDPTVSTGFVQTQCEQLFPTPTEKITVPKEIWIILIIMIVLFILLLTSRY